MDFYPEDLLVGVFPLVFAVNSILGEETFTKEDSKSSSSHRSLFEKFLDAIAASLIHDGAEEGDRKRTVSLFRSEDESSDDDDTSDGHYRRKGGGALSTGIYSGFGRRNFDPSRLNNVASKTAYAKALQHGEGFFERARIESVSTKHGFPPSKDPEGHSNLAQSLPAALSTKDNAKLKSLFEKHPLDGILPSGWLEKHVHALPSVILVVCTVSSSQTQQDRADKHLYNTVEHLYYSLVPKRQCTIHVIGLLQDNVTIAQGDGWCRAVNNEMLGNETGSRSHKRVGIPPLEVSILRTVADLESNDTGLPTSDALRALHRLPLQSRRGPCL